MGEIIFESRKYKKVDRIAKAGDLVVFTNVEGKPFSYTKDNKPYEVYEDENGVLRYKNDNPYGGNMVYGWNFSCPNPDIYELIE